MGRKTKRSAKNDEVFFAALSRGEQVSEAAKLAGYSLSSCYDYRDNDKDFARRWLYSGVSKLEALEIEADRRGVFGVDEPIYYKGQLVGHKKAYSDGLLALRLKAEGKEKYRDRQQVEQVTEFKIPDFADIYDEN